MQGKHDLAGALRLIFGLPVSALNGDFRKGLWLAPFAGAAGGLHEAGLAGATQQVAEVAALLVYSATV
jgi:hypothetical protein